MGNGKTVGFSGETDIKYADVLTGGEGMNMLVWSSGGRDAKIEPLFMVLKNIDRKYPMSGTPDGAPGVLYRTGPKGWMNIVVIPE